jgi:hypothetical protein
VWLKSVGTGSAQEPPLAAALAEWVPGRVLRPLAVHPGRRLTLLPDGGPTLRSGPTRLPSLVAELLADDDVLLLDRPDGLSTEVRGRIAAGLAEYADLCRRWRSALGAARRPARRQRVRRGLRTPVLRLR